MPIVINTECLYCLNKMPSAKLALIPVIALLIAILVTLVFGFSNDIFFNPPYLLLSLNLIFWTTATLAISFISAKSFLKEGSAIVIINSCSIIVFGVSVIISGWAQTFSVNKSIALSNPCILVASTLQVLSAILAFTGNEESKTPNRKRLLAIAYTASVIFVLVNTTIALLGYYPLFFAASGPTLLRQVILGSAVFFFAVASIIFGIQYLRSKSSSLYWYALAIGLFSVGLFSAFEQKAIGDVPTWLGRIGLYVGTLYLTAAILASRQKVGADLAGKWAEAFRSDRKQIADFFSNMIDGFVYCKIVTDTSGNPIDYIYLDANDAAEHFVGVKRENLIGKRGTEVLFEVSKDPAKWIGIYGNVALTGAATSIERYSPVVDKWYHASIYSPLKGYFVAIFEDITERKIAESKLKDYQNNLEKLVEERTKQLKDAERLATIGATAGMVGHDIRNPLQAITGDLFLAKTELADLPDSKEKKNALESMGEIEKNIDYINKIVQDLQDYARPLNPKAEESDLKQIVEGLIAKNGLPENVEVNVNVAEDTSKISADAYYLNRILSNLVTNAVQAMPQGGKLTIEAHKEANDTVITVSDTGVGIPKNIQDKMFTLMFTTKSKGQGFGLPVVKRMTESLGGTVSFESQEGKGTTFTIRLPIKSK